MDPDDPIAVGRQKERHKVIDECVVPQSMETLLMESRRALAHLDMQLALMKNGKHPQLVWMLDELETRRNKQLSRLEARYE